MIGMIKNFQYVINLKLISLCSFIFFYHVYLYNLAYNSYCRSFMFQCNIFNFSKTLTTLKYLVKVSQRLTVNVRRRNTLIFLFNLFFNK